MKIIFVDGYNVINSWPDLKIKKNNNFDGARRSLIDTMHNYGVYNDCKVIIVFDAHKVPGSIQKLEAVNKNLSIIFTKDGETADSYIEKEVNLLGRKYEVIVVTSDWLEQQTIFQRGAVRMSSLEFYNEVLDVENSIRKRKSKSKVSDKNILSDNIDLEMLKKLEKIRRSE
ncbi:NYN domain-containing protein [Clostridium botulinum]|uniref:NYN domain-containing protein n=1 Tax=Clostridium TaxID=1485 RepID=UPI0002E5F9F5|nr:NYN domain-containing protein [Clostridium sp. M14]AIY79671.1 yacP-like NYN domain protein [Clostridium botulinum 202F]KAI3344224.1 NYN domain-containing protein [Clostridium botulinum]NFU15100.1 NYN domain-containing protein [Clostridium sporogenes]KFX55244.1 RNA-binding protein [Clostridium botulinum]KFX56362.1 RNA-binding protein [Clostridium botulinum]